MIQQKTTAKFRKLALILRDQIENGYYKPGTIIPSESQLQEQFNVSRNTVRDAIELLVQDGYLHKKRGRWSGTIVLERKKERVRMRKGLNFGTLGSEEIVDSGKSDVPIVSQSIIRELDRFDASLSLFPFLSQSHPDQLMYVKRIIARNLVDGFFLWGSSDIVQLSDYLLSIKFPFVYISTNVNHLQSFPGPCVCINETETVHKIIREKAAHGTKKVIVLAGRDDLLPGRTDFLMAKAASLYGLKYQCLELHLTPFTDIVEVVREHASPETLFVTGNELVESVDNAISLLKLNIPSKAQLILFKHYSPDWQRWKGKYPVIDRPYEKLGRCAVRMMQKILLRKETGLPPETDIRLELSSFCE